MNTFQAELSEKQLAVMLELLREERRELPMEIRHTDSMRYHDELQARLKVVDELIEKLEQAPVH